MTSPGDGHPSSSQLSTGAKLDHEGDGMYALVSVCPTSYNNSNLAKLIDNFTKTLVNIVSLH